ncbi:MAG: sel1 repeat family protein [Candidatus Riflebacteria bacterium]|nr:sel1 repeat family protein [Candidatus Riflebacteria bacterium]
MKKQNAIKWWAIGGVSLFFALIEAPVFAQHNPIPTGPFAVPLFIWMILTDKVFHSLGHPLADILAAIIVLSPVFFVFFLAWANPGGFTRKIIITLFTCLLLIAIVYWFRNSRSDNEIFAEKLKLAEQGDARSQFYIGTRYQNGYAVPKDYKEAMKWLLKSAEQGYVGSQQFISRIYADGKGVPADRVQAYTWSCIAAANQPQTDNRNGIQSAVEVSALEDERDMLASQLTPTQQEEGLRKAREWHSKHPDIPWATPPK